MTPVVLTPLLDGLTLPDDDTGEELILGWRSIGVDGTSRDGYRWPEPGQWTVREDADRADVACSHGLHVARTWAGASSTGSIRDALLVAYRPTDVAHVDAHKVRVDQAVVLARFDPVALIRAGWMAGANLWGADLGDADLRAADLRGAYLGGANLGDADLRAADLWGADLAGADLGVADLRGANLWGADLWVAYLTGANLRDADLRDAYLAGANLRDANLRDADLRDAYLAGAYLTRSNLTDANLRDAHLRGASLRGASLAGANLRGADLGDADLWDASANRLTVWPDGFDPIAAGVIVR